MTARRRRRTAPPPANWWGDGPPPWERWPGASLRLDDRGGRYHFDAEAAKQACDFFPAYLRHVKGDFAGQPFELLPWQRDLIVRPLFGWKRADGTRRFRKAFLEVGKKNGKSGLASGMGLLLAFGDDEPGAEVYAAAADRDQARIVFGDAAVMARENPKFLKDADITVLRNAIVQTATNSTFKAVSSEVGTKHGFNVHGLIFDEFHTQRSRNLYDTLYKGTSARRQPVVFIITTAGDDRESICYEEYEYAKKVRDGVIEDEQYLPVIFESDAAADWTVEATWRASNPSLGVTKSLEYMRAECAAAQAEPRKRNSFLRLELNIWTESRTVWIAPEAWEACRRTEPATDLATLPCCAGMDLSASADLTAVGPLEQQPSELVVADLSCPLRAADAGLVHRAGDALRDDAVDPDAIRVVVLLRRDRLDRGHDPRQRARQRRLAGLDVATADAVSGLLVEPDLERGVGEEDQRLEEGPAPYALLPGVLPLQQRLQLLGLAVREQQWVVDLLRPAVSCPGPRPGVAGHTAGATLQLDEEEPLRREDEQVHLVHRAVGRRAAHLREEVAALKLPAEYKVMVEEGEFEPTLTALLDGLQADKAHLAPCFAMIDPFGVSGLPFTLVERLLQNDKCEVLVTIMTGHIERFIAGPEFGKHVPLLVGDPNAAAVIAGSGDRVAKIRELYMASLNRTAQFVRYFTMLNDRSRPVYDLFFASQHPLGHQKMKEAMWGIDDSGSFAFSDATDQAQQVLFRGADAGPLARTLSSAFRGKTVEVEVVLTFVRDKTAYIDKHCRAALKRLEDEGAITVEDTKTDGSRRKKGTFPPAAVVTFG